MNLFVTSYNKDYNVPKLAGIYTITNIKNKKVYIGETI